MLTRALVVVVLAFYFLAGQVLADTGVVHVRATVGSAITVSIDHTAADFGTTPQPGDASSERTDIVPALNVSGGNRSGYFSWTVGGNDLSVKVRSNLPWTRITPAEENSATASSLSLASAG